MKRTTRVATLVLLTTILPGCMQPWGRQAAQPSSLNQYLDRQAEAPTTKSLPNSKERGTHALAQSESEKALADKLQARIDATKQDEPASTTFAKRVEALSLPNEDKQKILSQFADASDAQWEELLSKLEPVFGAKSQSDAVVSQNEDPTDADLVKRFASKLVDRHMPSGSNPKTTVSTEPKRLPSAANHQDTSHLAQANPDRYPKTIDLETENSVAHARGAMNPAVRHRAQTNVKLATYVDDASSSDGGLYPEDLQTEQVRDERDRQRIALESKMSKNAPANPKQETLDDLSAQEFQVMDALWDRGQISLEAMHKALMASSEAGPDSPNPSSISIDELHTMLFDLKQRDWISDSRRGNTIVYWAQRPRQVTESHSWDETLASTIQRLERVAADRRLPEEERTLAQLRLRMLYLVAGRKSDALERIEELSPEEQEVWSNTLFGLADYMKLDDVPLERRHRLALTSFKRVMAQLEKASPLELRNLEFIQSVDSFGQFKPFPTREFRPQQEVLLYMEIDNFTSRESGGSFETVLQCNYEIYDQAGRRVDARQFPEVKDQCRVRRRDFYVPYRIYMPENVEPGNYRMELTVRDAAADKFGQASIEFKIRP